MHLLLAQKGTISDGNEAVDLGQTPGEIVFLFFPPPIRSLPALRRRTGLRRICRVCVWPIFWA